MPKRPALEQYQEKLAEARVLARGVAKDLRGRAKELVLELGTIAEVYEQLSGEPLPEIAALNSPRRNGRGRGASSGRIGRGTPDRSGKRGKRTTLKGHYSGKTIPEAVLAAIGKSKSGLGPSEIAEKIGGNRNSISVAMVGMMKDGLIKRASRGKYVVV